MVPSVRAQVPSRSERCHEPAFGSRDDLPPSPGMERGGGADGVSGPGLRGRRRVAAPGATAPGRPHPGGRFSDPPGRRSSGIRHARAGCHWLRGGPGQSLGDDSRGHRRRADSRGRRRAGLARLAARHDGPLFRRLCDPGGARSRRHGDRLQGHPGQPQQAGGPQNDQGRRPGRRRRAPTIPERGRGRRAPRPSGDRPGSRGRRARRPALFLHEARRGGQPRRSARDDGPRSQGRRDPPGRGGRSGASCPHAGHPAPRPEAGEHPGRRGGPLPHHRLRPGQTGRRRRRDDRERRDHGHAGLHEPRTGEWSTRDHHDRDRRLRPGGDPLRPANGQGPIRRR